MKLTNRLNLPSSIVNAVARDPYHRGDAHISVTALIGPARKRMLEIVHGDELTEDVADRIWSLMGQIAHGILERNDADGMTEERLFIERHGWRISGQFDRVLVEDKLVQDYKLSSTYATKDGVKPEWEAQANLYALMLREHGYPIQRAQIVVILRDYQKSKAQHDPDYPQAPVIVLDVPLWSTQQIEMFIWKRLSAHADAQHVLPLCSAEERWERPAKYALVKDGNKRATSLHDDYTDAYVALEAATVGAKKGASFRIDTRPAEQIRCKDYCPAAPVCQQWQAMNVATGVKFVA